MNLRARGCLLLLWSAPSSHQSDYHCSELLRSRGLSTGGSGACTSWGGERYMCEVPLLPVMATRFSSLSVPLSHTHMHAYTHTTQAHAHTHHTHTLTYTQHTHIFILYCMHTQHTQARTYTHSHTEPGHGHWYRYYTENTCVLIILSLQFNRACSE